MISRNPETLARNCYRLGNVVWVDQQDEMSRDPYEDGLFEGDILFLFETPERHKMTAFLVSHRDGQHQAWNHDGTAWDCQPMRLTHVDEQGKLWWTLDAGPTVGEQ